MTNNINLTTINKKKELLLRYMYVKKSMSVIQYIYQLRKKKMNHYLLKLKKNKIETMRKAMGIRQYLLSLPR